MPNLATINSKNSRLHQPICLNKVNSKHGLETYQFWSKYFLGDYSKTIGTDFKMVCASDGKTYSNIAMLEAWSDHVVKSFTKQFN